MTIKNSSARLFCAILALVINGAMLHAQDLASTNQSDTNAATAQVESSAADTNILSATTNSASAGTIHKNRTDDAVRIDNTGIHVGRVHGSSPVDINWGNNQNFVPSFEKTSIALAAILSPFIVAFGLPIAIIFTVFYFRHRQNRMMHDTIRTMVEKGIPVTPELISVLNERTLKLNAQGKLDPGAIRNRRLLPGLILTGVGIALTIALPEHSGPAGLIILFIGLAFLIVWLVERKQNANDQRKQDNDQQPPKI